MVRMGDGSPQVWYTIVEEMESKLKDIEFQGEDILLDWRKAARRRKIDREIFEKYGYFKDIILHPKFQMVKQYLEEHANFDLQLGDPIMPLTTAVIILFMLHRRISNLSVSLVAAFLFNLNPLYVSLYILFMLLVAFRPKPKQYISRRKNQLDISSGLARKKKSLQSTLTASTKTGAESELVYDHVLIGNSIGTLYTAALLAQCGHQCCVLQPKDADKLVVCPEGAPCSAPLEAGLISRPERYQRLLDIAQICGKQRATFWPVGSSEDGYTSAVVRLLHNQKASKSGGLIGRASDKVLSIRLGEGSLIQDLCNIYHSEKSAVTKLFLGVKAAMLSLSYLLGKRLATPTEWSKSSRASSEERKSFFELCGSSLESTLRKEVEEDDFVRAVSALTATIAVGECLPGNELSGVSLAALVAATEMGRFAPNGGIQEVEASLVETIQSVGGTVLHDVDAKGLVLEKSGTGYQAVGVEINEVESGKEVTVSGRKSIVSGMGVLCTYANMLPADAVSEETKKNLSLLREARPKIRCLFWLSGSTHELGLSSAEYFEIPSQHDLLKSQKVGEEESIEQWAASYVRIWSPSAMDPCWMEKGDHPSNVSVVVVEFEATEPLVSLQAVRWLEGEQGPSFYVSSRDEASDPNHDDFATKLGRPMLISASKREDFLRQAEIKLHEVYPLCAQRHVFSHCEVPTLGGHRLANTASKLAGQFSARTEVGQLFLTGSDLAMSGLMGEFQSGWLTASAILGYTLEELEQGRNVTTDLQRL
eukprot:scaffold753_cov164-Ochromonas_danica.AAC.8